MNKRGQGGLSMNTVVVAIVAIIVLLLVVTFFTGGLGTIGQRITNVFQTGTAGYTLDLAVQNCRDFCARAQDLPGGESDLRSKSAYCQQEFSVDEGGETPVKKVCAELVDCPTVKTVANCKQSAA
tara:strand:+ start:90 stop:464 length:375 start_codon:yes stop_codon:yes gene_type:complete